MPYEKSNHRIDMVWLNSDNGIIAGFEVDRTVYPKSISKLNNLPKESKKIIISMGLGKKSIDIPDYKGGGIDVLNLTQSILFTF